MNPSNHSDGSSRIQFSDLFERVTRPESRSFKAYHVPQDRGFARMHQNEGALPLGAKARNELAREFADVLAQDWSAADSGINVYPQLVPFELRQSYADYLGVPPTCVEVFPGSSDALQTIAAGCFRRGSRVAFLEPSFSILHEMVGFWGAEYVPILLDNLFSVLKESLFSEEVLNADVVILCTPNNPTGVVIPPEFVREFVDRAKGLVVIDEAYFEFAKVWDDQHQDFIKLALDGENVVLLRTLSKAWGAAGLRVGALIAAPQWVEFFSRLKHPYAISRPAEILGSYILSHKRQLMHQIVSAAVDGCRALMEELVRMGASEPGSGFFAYPSRANFVLLQTPYANQIVRECYLRGVLVRSMELPVTKASPAAQYAVAQGGSKDRASFVRVSPWSDESSVIFLEVTRMLHKGESA